VRASSIWQSVVEHAPEERRLVFPFADRQSADGTLVLSHGKEQPGGALGRSRFAPRALRQPSTAMKNETSVFTRAWGVGE
jgi:hypothetical protein